MFDINQLMNRKRKAKNQILLFLKLSKKTKTKKEKRILEEKLLKPIPLQIYTGKLTGPSNLQKKSLSLVFKKEEDIKRLGKFIIINPYINNNCYRLDLFLVLLELLENKTLIWDKDNSRLTTKKDLRGIDYTLKSKRRKRRRKL